MQEDNHKNTMHNEDQNHDIGRKIEESFHPEYAAAAENTDAQQAQAENATAPGADEADGIPVIDDYQYGATTDGPYSYANRAMDDAAQSDGQPHYAPPVYTQQPAASGTPFWEQGGAKQSAKQEKPKSRLTKGGAAVIVALCVLFSAVFGIGGGVLGNYIYAQANPQESTQQSQSASQSDSGMLHTSDSADLSSKTKTLTSVVDFAADSVVEITTEAISMSYYFQQLISTGAGSGVILTEDGYIVTNNHVISGASKIAVTLKNGEEYSARLVGTDSENDLAVIKIEATGLKPATFADSDELQVGQVAVAIGNPLGKLGGTVTEGIISALDREIDLDGQQMRLLQTSAAVNPGNSGGGLFDENGYLIGIVNAKSAGSEIEGLGFAIPSNEVKTVTDEIISGGGSQSDGQQSQGGVRLGVTLIDIDDEQTAAMYRVSEYGVYVIQVQSGSNASNAGIQAGDRIVSVNGETIDHADDVSDVLQELSVGDTMRMTISRGGTEITTDILLAG